MTREEMESRRMMAITYFERGVRQGIVWRKLGVSSMAVSRWHRDWKSGISLKSRKAPGRKSRMSACQVDRLRDLCKSEWSEFSTAELAILIHRYFEIRYNRDSIGRLMRRLHIWSPARRVITNRRTVSQ